MLERFLCIKDGGLELYSKEYFNSHFKVDQQLLAGFFYAIQSISEEIKNPVSFIRLQNSLVYLKTFGDFFLVLMFTSKPEESQLNKAFDQIAKVIMDYFPLLNELEYPQDFIDRVDTILIPFTSSLNIEPKIIGDLPHKIAILGLAKAGKTSIKKKFFDRYSKDILNNIKPTIGIETSKNPVNYLDDTIIVMDFGGQNLYRKNYLKDERNWTNISTIIYVIDIQDTSSFTESLDYLNNIWDNILKYNTKNPLLTIFLHKYDKEMINDLNSNLKNLITLFNDYIDKSIIFFTSIDDHSSINAVIKTLFLSLPTLIIKQILQSFLIDMFQEIILDKIKEFGFDSKDSKKLIKAGESVGENVAVDFQIKWLNYYLGEYKVVQQQLKSKKAHISVHGSSLTIEIDNWENEGISSEITNPFLTGFLNSLFRSLYVSPTIITESNRVSTIWKIEMGVK